LIDTSILPLIVVKFAEYPCGINALGTAKQAGIKLCTICCGFTGINSCGAITKLAYYVIKGAYDAGLSRIGIC
jgi:hypothetical protein